jgi:hypothetical protein
MYNLPLSDSLKTLARRTMPHDVWLALKSLQRKMAFNLPGPYSWDEPAIRGHIQLADPEQRFFVDIGAQDGVLGSQTLGLAKQGWSGVSYEGDDQLTGIMSALYRKLPSVTVRNAFVTPLNVCELFERDDVPPDFGFLNLDIDSYDFFVLRALLGQYSPRVICVEINEMIPPPIRFTIQFDEANHWTGDRFQGFSIQMAKGLCNEFGYAIAELHYNNLILVKQVDACVTDQTIADVYRQGYVERPDRKKLFPWNEPFDRLLNLETEAVLAELEALFQGRRDKCILEIERAG